ncbi:hypothetical protein SY88_11060 [Clostridiales bacterium PH28_bin88]|nr:hypothetical protein SY88_11060 [Clostridiales bacterium PH28_bin88]
MARTILAGLLAAGVAWAVNRWLVGTWGNRVITGLVPLVEEVVKTGLAVGMGVNILPVHTVFGAVELVSDFASPRPPAKSIPAGALALAGHLLFGYLTAAGYTATGRWWWGLVAGIAVHLTWNTLAVKVSRRFSG